MAATFDITSLLASTPRSRHLRCVRAMRIHVSRSPRSATRRIRLRTAFQLTPTRRWRPRRRSTPKGSGEIDTPPARRHLELTDSSRAQLLVVGDAQLCEEPISITTIQSFLGNLVEIAREHYPELTYRFLSGSGGTYHWLELKSPKIHFDPDLGPSDVVRMVISEQRLYYIQVMFPILRSVTKGLIDSVAAFQGAVSIILPSTGFVLCPGFPKEGYNDRYNVIRFHMKGVHVMTEPIQRYEAEGCLVWHKPSNRELKVGDALRDVCSNCKKVYSHVSQMAENAVMTDETVRLARTSTTSNYSWGKLSPNSQQIRRSNLVKERRDFAKQANQLLDLTGMPLDDVQDQSLASIVNTISSNQEARSTLEKIFSEAESSKEGRGDILRCLWEKEKERAAFFKDQKCCRTGDRGNRWSLVTYRVALAVYSRSPAAFEAIKHLGILQLPSSSSLQAFMSSHQRDPGANEEHMELQNNLYEQHMESKVNKGSMKPKRDGILIFDEVKVQGGVAWNSKNNQIIGLAMSSAELPVLHDIYATLDDSHKTHETHYVLQFVWRDLTSKFDIVGPYYTSEDGFDAQFTLGCVHDALFLLAAYNFNVLGLVGDGASWNLSLFKNLCGHKGKFRCNILPESDKYDVPVSFIDPFTGLRVWCIICPSHELKSLIAALHSSRDGGTKHFFKGGSFLGWKTLERLWSRELDRSRRGEMMCIPRMKGSYIKRDSWTRLSVTPAKIMQQEKVLAELRTHLDKSSATDSAYDRATLSYLEAVNKIFEKGLLSHDKVTDGDDEILASISEGLEYFIEWCDEAIENGVDVANDGQKVFLAWQTWDLLRMAVNGFMGLCQDFFSRNPCYYVQPVRVNGSVIESLFSRFKYHANGHLSAVNYRGAVAKMVVSDALKKREDYRGQSVGVHEVLCKHKYKRKKNNK